ncbi:E1-E2 ATPase-domain-containing protein [Mycena pura]|uniref:E1-E2 ATPase-domain-containing protein n=1 Tax=Mycena pura TaxID=153505 RepID=A0AAD6YSX3_9AGAR|nr:E1-E2 ATPase-domain-containing protein [Mycena pura]
MSAKRPSYRFHPSMDHKPLGVRLTTIHVSNLHCGSCVITIELALAALNPPPVSVDVSVVSQAVSVRHIDALSPDAIQSAILDAGFDVDIPQTDNESSDRHQKHVQQCALCQSERSDATPPASTPSPQLLRLTLSVGGMTCSSCTGSITRALEDIPGVSDVVVSLLEKSATALITRLELADVALESVENCGFDAQLMSVQPVTSEGVQRSSNTSRIISLRVDGMFCKHCPMKAMAALKALGPRVVVVTPITSHTNPVLTVSYKPDSPSLTIRTIIAALESSNFPPFQVTIHKLPSLEERARAMHAREQQHLLYRLIFTIVVAIPTFIIGIVFMSLVKDDNPTRMYFMEPIWTGNTARATWALFFLALPVMFYSAALFHRRSIHEIRGLWRRGSRTPIWKRFVRFGSMNLLVSTGVSVAFFASVGLLALAAQQPRQQQGDTTTYFDSVVLLTMFLLAGRYLEGYSKAHTADAISALASLRPVEAQLVTDALPRDSVSNKPKDYDPEKAESDAELGTGTRIVNISPELLEVGDIVRCNAGVTPPADGTIVAGDKDAFNFDESMLTGEAMAVVKRAGDQVYLGSINKGQSAFIRVDTVGGGTMLDNIAAVVREGSTRRAPIERIADVITAHFVPVVTLLAVLTWLLWLIAAYTGVLPASYLDIQIGGWVVWSLEFSIAVFVVACPCGIGLAAPTALLVGSGLAAQAGLLARGGGEAFQEMSRVDVIVFDKTGTLTAGVDPCVSDSFFTPTEPSPWTREALLGMAAALESASSHPLAGAVRRFCEESGASERSVSEVEETPGLGVEGRFGAGTTAIVGSQVFMEQRGFVVDARMTEVVEEWKAEAKSVVFLAVSDGSDADSACFGGVVAAFAVTDPIRSEAPGVVSWFAKRGVSTWMISGDNAITAHAVAKMVGIPEQNVIAGVLPHEKGERIEMLQARRPTRSKGFSWFQGRDKNQVPRSIVAMVGDGVNDSIVSDVAISSASFILLSSDLRSLMTLCDLAQRIMNRVRLNFAWAIVYNIAALPIAAGALYPAGHIRLDPVWASLAMALSSVSVVCSSLALKLYRPPKFS